MTLDITAIILTFNESIHLKRCIESLHNFAAQVIVVDSFSSDDTREIAERAGATFLQNAWINHASQFQWALETANIETEWIFRIDADEYIESELKQEIANALATAGANITGFFVRRKYIFLGQWIRHGAMYPIDVLRLFRRGTGRVEQRWMDEHIVLMQGRAVHLLGNIVDDNLNHIDWWIKKHNDYATREMIDLLNLKYGFMINDNAIFDQQTGQTKIKRWVKQAIYTKLPFFIRPTLYFVYRYFLRLGFLDGTKGFAFHFMQGYWYRCLVDVRMLEAEDWIGKEQDPNTIKKILKDNTGLKL